MYRHPINITDNLSIQILSRDLAERYFCYLPHIFISVTDMYKDFVELPKNENRKALLQLKFSDVDDIKLDNKDILWSDRPCGKIVCFSKDQALQILTVLNNYHKEVQTIIINCEAGISRSAAIGAAIAKIASNDDSLFFKYFLPNRLVYKTILNTCEELYQ